MAVTAKVSTKLRYIDHPAFASHTPAQWVEIVNHAVLIREAYTGPRTNMAAHIDAVVAGKRALAPVLVSPGKIDVDTAEFKFFPRDVIGKQPADVGSSFKAQFFGAVCNFKVTSFGHSCFMATLAR